MDLVAYQYDLKLRYPFGISRHTYDFIQTVIIELVYENFSGFGEATTNPYYHSSIDSLKEDFSIISEAIEDYEFYNPERLWHHIYPLMQGNLFALAALDCAAHDLYCKMRGRSFHYQYGIDYFKYPFTSYTLGISSPDDIHRKIKDLPWPVYKVKLGTGQDEAMIREVRKNSGSLIRIDANSGWTLKRALELMPLLEEAGVEFIEQPLPPDQWQDVKELKEMSAIPLIADESCVREEDVKKCVGHFDGINIKLSKCGGLTPALRMIRKARELGLSVMIGCMTESTIGVTAAAQLLPLVNYADLDGPLLLREDLATGVKFKNGYIKLKNRNGLGFRFKYEKFESDHF